MSLPTINPTQTKAWKLLEKHFQQVKNIKMQHLFAKDPSRADRMKISWNDFYVDFSKNRITDETLSLLLNLAEEVKLKEAIKLQFSGAKINQTEDRAVLHTALRDFSNMRPEVERTLQKMKHFSEAVIQGDWKGYSGKPITDIVNIGIGGSDLGPKMVTEALKYYKNHLQIHFVSNVDGDHVMETLKKLNRDTTLFIIVSKSFTTQETIINANSIKDWFLNVASTQDIDKHFIAVSRNPNAVKDFGITDENTFPMWDWVGGRFSLWSAAGLSICCSIGYDHFEELLKGAHKMDTHFKEVKFSENIPVILAVLSVWYNNFYRAESEAVVPYSQYLEKFVPYLQQLVMESNGKNIDRNGNEIKYQTGTIVWGSTGVNAQHAFFQLLHQGTKIVPIDFIGFSESLYDTKKHHSFLMANLFAQKEALLYGTFDKEIENIFNSYNGNNPSNTILINKLTPNSLGSLIAMYEHKVFVQGILWNIFSYDQWGVELGKKIAKENLSSIKKKN